MKIWISDTQTPSHRLVRLNCEAHSAFEYLGDLDSDALKVFLVDLQESMDVAKNMKLLNYYGYLHLLILTKK